MFCGHSEAGLLIATLLCHYSIIQYYTTIKLQSLHKKSGNMLRGTHCHVINSAKELLMYCIDNCSGTTVSVQVFIDSKKFFRQAVGNALESFGRKIRTHLDLLSIPQSGGKMSKRLGGIIGCKYKTSSWHLNGFPAGSNIGSTV